MFAAPRRLDLRLVCTAGTRVEKMLDIWPSLPIDLRVCDLNAFDEDNVVAVLEQNDRICKVKFQIFDEDSFQRFAAAMQVPFPALTDLFLAAFYLAL